MDGKTLPLTHSLGREGEMPKITEMDGKLVVVGGWSGLNDEVVVTGS